MALQDDLSDALAEIRRLTARIEKLERANPLENASITEGPGIRIGTPEGLRGAHKDSVSIEADEGLKIQAGASGKVDPGGKIALAGEIVGEGTGKVTVGGASMDPGSGGKVGAGGTWISADGGIRNDAGKITLVHQVDPLQGVLMSWGTGRHSIEQVTGWLQGDINSVSGRTTTAQNRADSAYSLANGKASQAQIEQLQASLQGLANDISDSLVRMRTTYNNHIDAAHPGLPKMTG